MVKQLKESNRLSYKFHLEQPARVLFGRGARKHLGDVIKPDDVAALVCGSRTLIANGAVEEIKSNLACDTVDLIQLPSCEPTITTVNDLTTKLKSVNYSKVIGLGGGSTLDSVKASSIVARQPGSTDISDYLEGIGQGFELTTPGPEIILLPTTAGTGSEATKNAVILSSEHQVKKSIRSPLLLPSFVIIDPELHASCNATITTHSGMDAITQCFESFISIRATEYTRTLAMAGFKLGIENIIQAIQFPNDLDARTALAHCAFNSGVSLANSGLGVAHGLSAAFGDTANLSHGASCSILLPFAATLNQKYCNESYCQLATAIGLRTADQLTAHIRNLCDLLQVPSKLADVGLTAEALPKIVERSYGNSMSGNPFRPEPGKLAAELITFFG